MWSETVSVMNLQTLKSMKKCTKSATFTFKIQKIWGGLYPLCPLNSPPLHNTSGSAPELLVIIFFLTLTTVINKLCHGSVSFSFLIPIFPVTVVVTLLSLLFLFLQLAIVIVIVFHC